MDHSLQYWSEVFSFT